jgi:quercetin dioxygenase-like cupin family protein
MKRHPALVPLSHDHHHALVEARRLRRAADTPESAAAATAFLRFFADQTVRHFREEEELLFPRVLEFEEARELLVQALLEHQRLHALTTRLKSSCGSLASCSRRTSGSRSGVVPLIERLLEDVTELQPRLREKLEADAPEQSPGSADESAPDELNVTKLSWKAGSGPPEHVNEERDVLMIVLDGSATLNIDGEQRELARGETAIIAKGRKCKITAGADGVRYLSVHRRRPPVQIGRAPERGDVHGED